MKATNVQVLMTAVGICYIVEYYANKILAWVQYFGNPEVFPLDRVVYFPWQLLIGYLFILGGFGVSFAKNKK